MNQTRRYYLSRIIGCGSVDDAHRPFVSSFGNGAQLDYRRDRNVRHGWCIACIDSANHPVPNKYDIFLADKQFVDLGENLDDVLSDDQIRDLRSGLALPFVGRTLREIIKDTQLCFSDLRPDGDGIYRIFLIDEVWSGTETEVLSYVADRIYGRHDKVERDVRVVSEVSLRSHVEWSIDTLREFYDNGASAEDRLDAACEKPKKYSNPVVAGVRLAADLSAAGSVLALSSDVYWPWINQMALNLRSARDAYYTPKTGGRMRDSSQVEALAFELSVVSAYMRCGAVVEFTDSSPTPSPECRVKWPGLPAVNIECKFKTHASVKPMLAQDGFDRVSQEIISYCKDKGLSCSICVRSSSDPVAGDAKEIVDALAKHSGLIEFRLEGKRVELVKVGPLGVSGGVAVGVPSGFDFAVAEGGLRTESSPEWYVGFAWKTTERRKWIKSAIETIKDNRQLPRGEPNVMYLAVPSGVLSEVMLRINLLRREVENLFKHSCRRISAVVLVGNGTQWLKDPVKDVETASIAQVFEVVENTECDARIPNGFKLLGRDFNR